MQTHYHPEFSTIVTASKSIKVWTQQHKQKHVETSTQQESPQGTSGVTMRQLIMVILLSIALQLAMMHSGSLVSAWDRGQKAVSFSRAAYLVNIDNNGFSSQGLSDPIGSRSPTVNL